MPYVVDPNKVSKFYELATTFSSLISNNNYYNIGCLQRRITNCEEFSSDLLNWAARARKHEDDYGWPLTQFIESEKDHKIYFRPRNGEVNPETVATMLYALYEIQNYMLNDLMIFEEEVPSGQYETDQN